MTFNQLRREKLSYNQILNISFLAITPAAWLQFLVLFTGSKIPFGFLGSLILTTAYLYFGIKRSEDGSYQEDFPQAG